MLREFGLDRAFLRGGRRSGLRPTWRPGARGVFDARARNGFAASLRPGAETAPASAISSRGLGRQRLQTPEPIPPLDGPQGRDRPWRLVASVAGAPHCAARYACHPVGAVPAPHAIPQPGWKMAAEITAALRAINPADPVRYDFSLCHVGMMNACGVSTARSTDSQCPLRGFCHPRPSGQRSRLRSPRRYRPAAPGFRDRPEPEASRLPVRSLSGFSRTRGLLLQLPQLRELQEHRIRVDAEIVRPAVPSRIPRRRT